MSNSNYPAGVTDNHPHFNPPRVSANAVECGADSALVVPSFAVKGELYALQLQLQELTNADVPAGVAAKLLTIETDLGKLIEQIVELEQETEYECPFNDEVDLEESECARWDCPVCGNERETDTLPEERDPDEEWERRNDR
jgi:hypothetical protein